VGEHCIVLRIIIFSILCDVHKSGNQ
jgi:hypothetical protein